jgi:sulfite reductase (NADPH) hemoprotein beta-component
MQATATDRSRDRSQPLDKLGPDETLKAGSDQLRGTILEGLLDEITGAVPVNDTKLMKFHGIYQQDDRDIRDERRHQRLEPAFSFMVRVRLPGGVCTPEQWLKLDQLARDYGEGSLRLTTRQTFQFHHVLKQNLRALIQGLHDVGLDTRAACGDDSRGVMCSVNPLISALHAEVQALAKQASDHAIPKTGAYGEIWYGEERQKSGGPEEPFYGKTYMPRKFKIGFVIPPVNDIDVYAQDLGFIASGTADRLDGFNVAIGGGMGRTDQAPHTYPRLADVIGFVAADKVLAVVDAVMSVQRDYGDRVDRGHARFKYTIDDKGLEWIRQEIEARQGFRFAPVRDFSFTSNRDPFGWTEGEGGRLHHTILIESGRITNSATRPILDGLREVARGGFGHFRLTPNQNLTIAGVAPERRAELEAILAKFGLAALNRQSGLRMNALACVALPTCGLAMAESERYLPDLVGKIEQILSKHDLLDEPITLRVSGCPNGCSRPYIAEIALTGRAPGKYNLYFGGGFHGQRLNKMFLENAGEAAILGAIEGAIAGFASNRREGEHFGDYAIRAGYVTEVTEGRRFND